jgi:hypothetical protein
MSIRDLETLDCELAVYRKGFLSVHIDLIRGYLTWRESNSWANNFTRSLLPEQIETLRRNLICSLERIQLPEESDRAADSDCRSSLSWSLCLQTPSGCCRGAGCDTLPEGWQELRQTIESVSRLPFSLR